MPDCGALAPHHGVGVLYCTVLYYTGGHHRAQPRPLPQRVAAAGGDRRDGGPGADGLHTPGQVPARHVQVTVFSVLEIFLFLHQSPFCLMSYSNLIALPRNVTQHRNVQLCVI